MQAMWSILELNSIRESGVVSGGSQSRNQKRVFAFPLHEMLIIYEAKSNFPFLEWNHLGRIPNQKHIRSPPVASNTVYTRTKAKKRCENLQSLQITELNKQTKRRNKDKTFFRASDVWNSQERDKIGENVLFLTQFFIQQNGHCWEFCLPCWSIRSFRLVNLKYYPKQRTTNRRLNKAQP